MLDFTTVGLFCVVFVLTYLYWKSRVPGGLPPGPKGWPFIGHLGLIYYGKERQFHVQTDKWGKEYGGIFNIQYAQMPSVMVTDLDILKEAFVDNADVWSDRPLHNPFLKMVTRGTGGVILQNGETWRKMRRLTVQSMKDFGMGKKSIEEKIIEEVNEVVKEIDVTDGKPFKFELIFSKAVANVICSVLFGNRYSYDDPTYQKLTSGLNAIFTESGFQNVFLFLPWYTFWLMPILQPNIRELLKVQDFNESFIHQVIKEHRESFDKDNLRDFVDLYLAQEQSDDADTYTEQRMFQVIMDLFLAGAETTSTTLRWAFLFFIKHPDVQRKCREEIKQKIGFDRLPSYSDRAELPYIEATIQEVIRLGSPVPIVLFHNTARTAELRGYKIPKNTALMANHYSIHTNPKYWDEPKMFKPERFLDENGKVKRHDAFIGFGLGRRACLGENLARMELFLFITGLLQKFEFSSEDISKLPSVDNTSLGLTLIPQQYFIQAKKLTA